jgi:hypothetical protein
MLKQYNFRIDPQDIKQIDQLNGTRSYNIRNAIQSYIKNQNNITPDNIYNVDTIQILKDQIQDLKHDKEKLYNQINFLSTPWYMRILLPKNTKKQKNKER